MSGYIDENARIADNIHDAYEEGYADGKRDAVVHGHWVFSENDDMFYCTNCKNGSVRNDYPYCHWCGAKMDEPTQSNDSNTLGALGEKVTK